MEESKEKTKKSKVEKTEMEKKDSELKYEESVKTLFHVNSEDEYGMKGYFVERCIYTWALNFYDVGEILLFSPKDKVLNDKALISCYSEGTSTEESEKLGIKVEKSFKLEEYVLISKKNITHFELSQNSCPNPDCDSCKNGETPPVSLLIYTPTKPIQIFFGKQSDAFAVMIMLTNWKDNNWKDDKSFKKFMDDPFDLNME